MPTNAKNTLLSFTSVGHLKASEISLLTYYFLTVVILFQSVPYMYFLFSKVKLNSKLHSSGNNTFSFNVSFAIYYVFEINFIRFNKIHYKMENEFRNVNHILFNRKLNSSPKRKNRENWNSLLTISNWRENYLCIFQTGNLQTK